MCCYFEIHIFVLVLLSNVLFNIFYCFCEILLLIEDLLIDKYCYTCIINFCFLFCIYSKFNMHLFLMNVFFSIQCIFDVYFIFYVHFLDIILSVKSVLIIWPVAVMMF